MEGHVPGILFRAVGKSGPLTLWLPSPAEARIEAARRNFTLVNHEAGVERMLSRGVAEAVFAMMIERGWRIEEGPP